MIAAMIDATGLVVNLIVADAKSDPHPEGYLLVNVDDAAPPPIGSTYKNGVFTPPKVDPPPVVVPESVTPRQVRLLLLSQGLLDQVEAMIAQQDQATKITWEFASEFRRDNSLLLALAQNLGLTQGQIDEFFIAAAAI